MVTGTKRTLASLKGGKWEACIASILLTHRVPAAHVFACIFSLRKSELSFSADYRPIFMRQMG
jgi:hypothetical protein